MKTISKILDGYSPSYPIERLAPLEQILFLDIETTGFTAGGSNLYLIGCIYYKEDSYRLMQWFAENYEEEQNVLKAFLEFCLDYSFLIHFNGNHFDIPYLQQKCDQYEIPFRFDAYSGIDLYHRIKPYKDFLKLENCKQKTIEALLGINRDDTFSGGDLIEFYHDYVLKKESDLLEMLLLHNEEDVTGMLQLCSILAIPDLFLLPVRVMKVHANYYTDINGAKRQELVLNLRFLTSIPLKLSYAFSSCYLKCEGVDGLLRIPMYEEEMKYFYSNYQDYYYLPEEDMAIHKSVASFVDKNHRKQATASTCYTKKSSCYLPQWEVLFTPFFKREYKSREYFFELTDEFKTDRSAFNQYASHILEAMLADVSF